MDGFNESALGKWLEGHKLFYQIFKFGIVGVVCFFIDYLVGLVAMNAIVAVCGKDSFEVASLIGSALGFVVSVIANYVLSFKFVFERKEDLDRKAEFVAFVILSLIGMGINSAIIYLGVSCFYKNIAWLSAHVGHNLMYTISKIFATAIVMVYNFITRKIFLEKKD